EDGIRDFHVTGVQTCALPIWVTTFGYKTSPLILIDGFEASTDDLARLQPDDIESFSILKDASATVLYGARGANGIIMVTTKAGEIGRASCRERAKTRAVARRA